MASKPRPFFNYGVAELEQLALADGVSKKRLREILAELKHRKSQRAARLGEKIRARLTQGSLDVAAPVKEEPVQYGLFDDVAEPVERKCGIDLKKRTPEADDPPVEEPAAEAVGEAGAKGPTLWQRIWSMGRHGGQD